MSYGREDLKVILAVDYTGDVEYSKVIDIPDKYKEMFENGDLYVEDFKNLDKVPKEMGVYELECSFWWDDGRVMFFEQSDSDWRIEIIKVNKLYDIPKV